MTARDAILAAVKAGHRTDAAPRYTLPAWTGDTISQFAERARSTAAEVHEIVQIDDAPEAIWSILVGKNAARHVHIPRNSPVNELPWQRAPGLTVKSTRPSGSDSAVSFADYAIAETGTVVFFSGERSASSWHFLPDGSSCDPPSPIVPRLENVIENLAPVAPAATSSLTVLRAPPTSSNHRGGAHGPRAVHSDCPARPVLLLSSYRAG